MKTLTELQAIADLMRFTLYEADSSITDTAPQCVYVLQNPYGGTRGYTDLQTVETALCLWPGASTDVGPLHQVTPPAIEYNLDGSMVQDFATIWVFD